MSNTQKTVHMFNSTFTLKDVGNDFDCLARVVRIDETGDVGGMLKCKQVLCYIDYTSLTALRDAITDHLEFEERVRSVDAQTAYSMVRERENG